MTLLESAMKYASLGYRVFPLKPRGKTPLTKHGHLDATTDMSTIKRWWAARPDANIGIACEGLLVLDFDTAAGLESKAKMEEDHGQLPSTWIVKTGGGTEDSPRSPGGQIFFKVPIDLDVKPGARKYGYDNLDMRAGSSYVVAEPSVTRLQYETIDGSPDRLADAPLWLIALAMSGSNGSKPKDFIAEGEKIPQGQNDQWLFSRAASYRAKGDTQEQIFAKIKIDAERLDQDPTKPYTDKDFERISKSAAKFTPNPIDSIGVYTYIRESDSTATKRDKSVTDSVTNRVSMSDIVTWIEETGGAWFSTDDIDKDFEVRQKRDKDNRRQIINRLKNSNVIEQHARNSKLYRYRIVVTRLIDFKTAVGKLPINIKYPFGIEDYFNTFPGNIVALAGAADAGKTAFLLNFIRLNMYDFPIYYQSSEMGDSELANRLCHFEGIDINDWNFTAEERSKDFSDVVRPDSINIIDYMEFSGDFYAVADYMRQIHDKLASGIAVIALQKKRGAELGRGGDFGLEKPRLYLSMDKGKMVIQKAKNWKDPTTNPNGLECNFKIVAGCKFIITNDWHKDEE